MLISASSSHLQLCGSKPCPRVIVQDKDAIFAVGWPVLRAGLDYVVHGLFWVAAVACGRVFQTPAFHSSGETANTGSEAVECCPLSAWEVFAQQLAWLIHESVQPRVVCCLSFFRPPACEQRSLGDVSRCGSQELMDMLREGPS